MRIRTGPTRKRRHLKVLKQTKGFRMTKGRLYKVSKEAALHAGQYAFSGRKRKKRDIRRLWIQKINAALKPYELSYSKFINQLKKKSILLDRKILADLAMFDSQTFESLVKEAKKN
ncbi:50S ribosomal protein L20 [Candidatus Woesebacteria bacterium CG_4_10_14_0_2_um_filter_39_14]|uniref:Large ribosomal subunit protein bL20 n=3 Tax=Microgenomates group TaxID=1794810 RepID=A0A2M6YPI2_9BACT|nr:MAG: 50S ribosomal protein L20 [Candidatus Shapirobacteria bacterium CG07_land_8_20_14_0_80_39_12]PIZ49400.1 MAG: 50S ribosomal protein L20 [Candidatus Woesebacteria bacterium CG_4_10_14_0_2_um_filter_39_14]PJA49859.1 MAG: 50S ribosomal protein L20 [Candidatus Shapirobacteria bacterium CG_4_9_14_3_um_filter_39_13]